MGACIDQCSRAGCTAASLEVYTLLWVLSVWCACDLLSGGAVGLARLYSYCAPDGEIICKRQELRVWNRAVGIAGLRG